MRRTHGSGEAEVAAPTTTTTTITTTITKPRRIRKTHNNHDTYTSATTPALSYFLNLTFTVVVFPAHPFNAVDAIIVTITSVMEVFTLTPVASKRDGHVFRDNLALAKFARAFKVSMHHEDIGEPSCLVRHYPLHHCINVLGHGGDLYIYASVFHLPVRDVA